MRVPTLVRSLMLVGLLLASCPSRSASGPPMGWNSWDAYGFTIDEQAFKANGTELADSSLLWLDLRGDR